MALDDLTDVNTTGVTDQAVLQYDSGSSNWVDAFLAVGQMTDVNTTGQTVGDILKYDGSEWVPGELNLNELADVDTTGVADGDILVYDGDGSTWVVSPLTSASTGPVGYAYRSTDQTTTAAVEAVVDFDQVTTEHGMTYNTTGDYFLIPEDGWYDCQATLRWKAHASGNADKITRIYRTRSGSDLVIASEDILVGASVTVSQSPGISVPLLTNDRISLKILHTGSNGTAEVVDSSLYHFIALSVTKIQGGPGPTGGAVDTVVTSLPAAGTPGRRFLYKGVAFEDSGNYWWPTGGAMEQYFAEWTHFFNNNAQKIDLQSSASGTSAAANAGTAAAGVQGLLSLNTGSTSTGRAGYAAGQSSALRGTGDKIMHFHTRVRFPTLSNGTDRYYFTAGYLSSLTGVPGDGFYFRYDDSVSANWYAVVVNNTTGTAGVSTGVAVANNGFQKLRIEIDEPAASANFYIDNVLTNTISTNFPGSTRDFGPAVNIRKTIGSNPLTAEVDYVGYWSLMTTII